MGPGSIFATPRKITRIEDCTFYHVMDIPGHGVTSGEWDLRTRVDGYLGQFPFCGKRVLEIGPASGFLTFEMEQRGADVVAVEISDDPGWDFVPYPESVMSPILEPRRRSMHGMKNSFWFCHALHRSRARLYYGDVYDLPDSIGSFDVAVMAAVLLHCHSPLRIIEQCAKRSRALVITDLYWPDLEGKPICRLVPSAENRSWDTWWNFSTDFFRQYLAVLGYRHTRLTTHEHRYRNGTPCTFFTLVSAKDEPN